jgi:hypothetical protein
MVSVQGLLRGMCDIGGPEVTHVIELRVAQQITSAGERTQSAKNLNA